MKKAKLILSLISTCLIAFFAIIIGTFITSSAYEANSYNNEANLDISITPGDRHDIYSGSYKLGNSVTEIMYGGKNLFLLNDYICANTDGITYYSYNENTNFTTPIQISVIKEASNLNLFDTTLYYVNKNKIEAINLEANSYSLIHEELSNKINMMYVINNNEILYSTDNSIYSYNLITKEKLFISNCTNYTGFIPCNKGIIFIKNNNSNNTYSLYINNISLISNIEKTFETDSNSLFFYEKNGSNLGGFEYEYKKIALDSLFYSFSSKKIVNITQEQKKIISTSNLQRNSITVSDVLAKAYSFYNNRWTPLKDVKSDIFSGGFTLAAGSIQVGVPYSQPIQGGFVGFNLSIDDFNKEALNPNSKLYTQKGTDGCIYYGSDCSGFVSYCMGHKRLTTVGINKAYTHLGKAPISEIKTGDVFNRTSSNRHVILITAIDSEKICTLEQTVPYIKYKETPLSQINTVFYNKKYTVYRNPELIQ